MTDTRPYLIISNDDGYQAPGLAALVSALSTEGYDILVVAPDAPRSGFSCSITSGAPLTARPVRRGHGLEVYACSGTPVDCVKLALNRLARRRPDLVIGGINHGDNSSVNSHYSGTMGVATEGALQGIPAVAFSLCDHRADADFAPLTPYLRRIVRHALTMKMPPFTCLNVNFPLRPAFEGVRICRMAHSRWEREIEDDPQDVSGSTYRLAGECTELEPEASDTDRWALAHGYVAITPTTLDNTDYAMLRELHAAAFLPDA
ncbi:MAG: 5'/3'-nucleotidase SurE [Alloprevotella sp.]|nr:5'/3'-nucleotidase SurE [Alloprevotella sp.]